MGDYADPDEVERSIEHLRYIGLAREAEALDDEPYVSLNEYCAAYEVCGLQPPYAVMAAVLTCGWAIFEIIAGRLLGNVREVVPLLAADGSHIRVVALDEFGRLFKVNLELKRFGSEGVADGFAHLADVIIKGLCAQRHEVCGKFGRA